MPFGSSELILNADRSIYHLNLLPEDIATTIITVGDPDRVSAVSKYFDSIELKKGKREFITHTGTLNGKRLSVISTGIGTDNVDIVLNELDALVNVDFDTRMVKKQITTLQFIRIGSAGAIQSEIPVDSFLLSEYALGFDGLLHFYNSEHIQYLDIAEKFIEHSQWPPVKSLPYAVKGSDVLISKLASNHIRYGITATNTGFYGPQGRKLRAAINDHTIIERLKTFRYGELRITNLEMETSGIYGLSKLLGHEAVSMNCILANRATGEFSKAPEKSMNKLIEYTLAKVTL